MPDFVKKRLIIIVGPTAVGKTKTAIQLAKIFERRKINCRKFNRLAAQRADSFGEWFGLFAGAGDEDALAAQW